MTNHAVVLLMVARNPRSTLRELAAGIGITERAVSAIVGDLEAAGYVASVKIGRGKRYELDRTKPLRHPIVAVLNVGDLLTALEDVHKQE
jgi:predicted transcriptional regulator